MGLTERSLARSCDFETENEEKHGKDVSFEMQKASLFAHRKYVSNRLYPINSKVMHSSEIVGDDMESHYQK